MDDFLVYLIRKVESMLSMSIIKQIIFPTKKIETIKKFKRTQVKNGNNVSRIAVHAHIFFEDVCDEIISYTNNIPENFDLYISTDSIEKMSYIQRKMLSKSDAESIEIMLAPNRGRDVAPLLIQMHNIASQYEYVCHIHSKKSLHTDFGTRWRRYLFDNLLYSREFVSNIIRKFDKNRSLGIIYPVTFPELIKVLSKEGNKKYLKELSEKIHVDVIEEELNLFPAGNMFWVRSKAVAQIFEHEFMISDFPEENGQLDFTLMHAVERSWKYIVNYNGYESECIKRV